MLDLNPAEQKALVDLKVQAYHLEAAAQRQIPRHSLRQLIAQQLRNWAEHLEPTPSVLSHRVRQA